MKNKNGRKILSVLMTLCMALSIIPMQNLIVYAGVPVETTPLTTVWKTQEVGTHTDTGSYNYDSVAKTITVNGAGTLFGKAAGIDDFFYAFFNTKGDTTITTKVTFSNPTAAVGYAGIVLKNTADTAGSSATAIYADYANDSKNQIRYGYHGESVAGGASQLNSKLNTAPVYIKLEYVASTGLVKYYAAASADFSDCTGANIKSSTMTGTDVKTVGFFATAGITATFSEVKVTSVSTANTVTTKKVIFDSTLGELIPTYSSSADYNTAGANTAMNFTKSANGSILNLSSVKAGTAKGDLRSDISANYLLFPATTANYVVSADITINSIDTGTDKHGIGIGQFKAVPGSQNFSDIYQANKNGKFQNNYMQTTGSANSNSNPTAPISFNTGATYSVSFAKLAATVDTPKGGVHMSAKGSNGAALDTTSAAIDLGTVHADLGLGKSVRYGLGISGAVVQIANLNLVDENGWVLYDQNDYYIEIGVAPIVTSVSTAVISNDKLTMSMDWTYTEGVGNKLFYVMVSKDGGAYQLAGTSKVNNFVYTPAGDGNYKFEVYGKSGDDIGLPVESQAIDYIAPLTLPVLTVADGSTQANLSWTVVANATSYDIYKGTSSIAPLTYLTNVTDTTYVDTAVSVGLPYYYYLVAKSATNASNPSKSAMVLIGGLYNGAVSYQLSPTVTIAGTLVYEGAASIITFDPANDTVLTNSQAVSGKVNEAGTMYAVCGGTVQSQAVTANAPFTFTFALSEGRNPVDYYFVDATNNITKKFDNFVYLKSYDLLVDAAFTGTDGDLTAGVPTYKTIAAAIAKVPTANTASKVIFIKNGSYLERVDISTPYISLIGEDSLLTYINKSVIKGIAGATGMSNRNVVAVQTTATGFTAENLTIENTYAYTNGSDEQADALMLNADQALITNVRLVSFQDTLLTYNQAARQVFSRCYITGNVDFIYGTSTVLFDDCDIVGRYTSYKADGCYVAPQTFKASTYGYVFNNCRFTSEAQVGDSQYRLARTYGEASAAIFNNCYLGSAVRHTTAALCYDVMNFPLSSARYYECNSFGPAALVDIGRPLVSSSYVTQALNNMFVTDFSAATAFSKNTAMSTMYIKADYSAVNSLISAVNTLIQQNYIDFSAVTAAVVAVVFDLNSSQQAQVNSMANNITSAVNALVKKDADYSALTAAIATADAFTSTNYVSGYSAVSTALTAAKAVPTGLKIENQATINTALATLNTAVTALVLKEANYTALTAAITAAEAFTSSIYSTESYAALTTALTAAKAVPTGLKIDNQSTIDAKVTALNTAVASLVRVVIPASDTSNAKVLDDNAVIPAAAKLTVEAVVSGTNYDKAAAIVKAAETATDTTSAVVMNQFVVFEIDLKTSANVAITQLDGKVSVSIPMPAGFDLTKTITVFRVESNGALTKLDTKIVDGKCVFITDHFSTYVVAEVNEAVAAPEVVVTPEAVVTPEVTTTTAAPIVATGDASPIALYALVLGMSACTFMYATRKKRIRKAN